MTESIPVDPGRMEMLTTERLLLDWKNPRLRSENQLTDDENPDSVENQLALARLIAKEYHSYRIAESIARHQYFHSEPMIAVEHGDKFRVIEGNRRLTAILGLQNETLRNEFVKESRGWRDLPGLAAGETFPVLIIRDERTIAPLLGYRHIAGIEPWGAYAQARYIVSLVEQGNTLNSVAELVGKSLTAVRSMYRDHDILEQGTIAFHIDTKRAREKFGVFNAAMGNRGIREYIGAPPPREVDPEVWPIPKDRGDQLREVLGWIFGTSRQLPLISDSRQLGSLSRVLADPSGRGLAVIHSGGPLDQAESAVTDPDEQFTKAVANSLQALRSTIPSSSLLELSPETISTLRALASFVSDVLREAEGRDAE